MLKQQVYTFYSDPGHGWLSVTKDELASLGIADQVSGYSYQRNGVAYLEEDCDYSLFVAAKEKRGEKFEVREVYQENTPIRGYQPYNGPR